MICFGDRSRVQSGIKRSTTDLSVDEGVVIKRSQEILRSQAQRKMDEAAALRGMHDLDAIVSKLKRSR
jgi:hypothetical protein